MRIYILVVWFVLVVGSKAIAGPLIDAAKNGNVELVKELINGGADVNEAGSFGTPLHWASLNGNLEVVAVLASHGANLSAKSDLLGTPLHAASSRNNVDVVAELLRHGANANIHDKGGNTPLHIAAKYGSSDAARVLIAAGATVDAVSIGQGRNPYKRGERTPLHLALQEGHIETANLLRSEGATAAPVLSSQEVLAGADVDSGRKLVRIYCKTCHAIKTGDPTPSALDRGPPLIGIVGKPVAQHASFKYSQSLREFGGDWTDDRLYSFVLRPMLTVPGTLMGTKLVRKPAEVADIVAYLKTLPR